MKQLTHDECILLASIKQSPAGDWTHDISGITPGPARFVDRVKIPSGEEVVYFRKETDAGAWPAASWDRFAVARELIGELEQMTLF